MNNLNHISPLLDGLIFQVERTTLPYWSL